MEEQSLTDREIVEALRVGLPLRDVDFDQIYPSRLRQVSERFWTPLQVARCAARLLTLGKPTRVLDVGAGVGKFCIVGALATGATFTGIEHRPHFVDVARSAAQRLGVGNARIVHGTLEDVRWQDFDALYFYNPFSENVMDHSEILDQTVELSPERLQRDILAMEAVLAQARIGTRVVTYHGFGGRIPYGYELAHCEPLGTGAIRLWTKVEESGSEVGRYEVDEIAEIEAAERKAG